MVEDRRIRGESGDRQLIDVLFERAAVQQVTGNVVEPETLALVVKQLRRFHRITSLVCRLLGRQAPSAPFFSFAVST